MTTPYTYQRDGVRAIHRFKGRAILSDDVGLGKTFQALLYASRHEEAWPIVVVCPASLKVNWQREAAIHLGVRAEVLEGMRPPPRGFDRETSRIVIVNYDILRSWLPHLKALRPGLVIFDESHMLAGRGTLRTRCSRALARKCERVLCLTATPVVNRPADLWPSLNIVRPDLFPSFVPFAQRWCLPADAPILMHDLKERPISEIENGDHVVGWSAEGRAQRRLVRSKVLGVVVREGAKLQKVTLTDGRVLICTPDHKWHTGDSTNSPYEYMVAKTGKPSGRGKGAATRIMKVADGLRPIYQENEDYMKGYIHGFWRGDGRCNKRRELRYYAFRSRIKKMRWRYDVQCSCTERPPIDRILSYLTALDQPSRSKMINNGRLHAISLKTKAGYRFISKTTYAPTTNAWWAGFLGGIYDAEGSGRTISQYKKINQDTFRMIQAGLQRLGFDAVPDAAQKSIRIGGGRPEFMRFWNVANPTLIRKLTSIFYATGGKFNHGGVSESKSTNPRVVSIELLPGRHLTYTLTTETGNYVAYGMGSKNCAPRRTPWGFDYRGASKDVHLLNEQLADNLLIRRTKADVSLQLPRKRRIILPIPIQDRRQYERALTDFAGWLREHAPGKMSSALRAKALVQMGYLRRLAANLKLPAVFEWVDNFIEQGDEKLILFAVHKKIIEQLMERYGGTAVKVDGSVTGRKRQAAVDQFLHSPRTRLFVGNIQAAGAGWSAKGVSTQGIIELAWSPGLHTQAEGRIHGLGRGDKEKAATSFYLVGEQTYEETLLDLLQKKNRTVNSIVDGKGRGESFDVFDELIKTMRGKQP